MQPRDQGAGRALVEAALFPLGSTWRKPDAQPPTLYSFKRKLNLSYMPGAKTIPENERNSSRLVCQMRWRPACAQYETTFTLELKSFQCIR
eukprot:7811633-Pyramimonas_sp.AAC.1